jgi:hypothetical protein
LRKLARVVRQDEKIKGITAKSWLVAKRPEMLTSFGFTLDGPMDPRERALFFASVPQDVPIHAAHIDRETLIRMYGGEE